MGMGSTHHLEGVGEGKVMVLGVGWMLSLFVVDRLTLEHQVWCGFFRSWHSGPKRALTLALLGKILCKADSHMIFSPPIHIYASGRKDIEVFSDQSRMLTQIMPGLDLHQEKLMSASKTKYICYLSATISLE